MPVGLTRCQRSPSYQAPFLAAGAADGAGRTGGTDSAVETPYALLDSAIGKGAAADPGPRPDAHGCKPTGKPVCGMAALPDATPQLTPLGPDAQNPPQSVAGIDICRELERMLSPPVKFAPTTLDSVMRSIGRDDGVGMFSTPAGDGGVPAAAEVSLAAPVTDGISAADGNRVVPAFEARLIEQQADGEAFCSPMELPPHGAATHGCGPQMHCVGSACCKILALALA